MGLETELLAQAFSQAGTLENTRLDDHGMHNQAATQATEDTSDPGSNAITAPESWTGYDTGAVVGITATSAQLEPEPQETGQRQEDTIVPPDSGSGDVPPIDVPPTSLGPEGSDEPVSPEQTDALFETQADTTPLTPEQRQAAINTYDTRFWLGYAGERPSLIASLDGHNEVAGPILSPTQADHMAGQQLGNLGNALTATLDGLESTQDLAAQTEQLETRSVLEQRDATRYGQVPRYSVGGFDVTVDGHGGASVEPQASSSDSGETPPSSYVHYTHPSGEIRIIKDDASERYRVTPANNQPTSHDRNTLQRAVPIPTRIIAETIRTIPPDSSTYFRNLHGMLTRHQEILVEAAEAAGIRADTFMDADTGMFDETQRRNLNYRSDIPGYDSRIPQDIRTRLAESSAAIWQLIAPTYTQRPDTGRTETGGLAMRGRAIADYRRTVDRM